MQTLINKASSFKFSKKQLFFLFSVLVSLLFSFVYFFEFPYNLASIGIATLASFLGIKFVLKTDFDFYWLVVSLFPTFFVLSTGLTQYYFPYTVTWFKIAFVVFFLFFFYALMLSLNIFKVARSREEEIPLLRPARTTLFLATTIISFFSFTVFLKGLEILIFQLFFVILFSFLFSFALFFLIKGFERRVLLGAVLIAFLCLEIFLSFAFVPVEQFFRGLIISAAFYVGISIEREYFEHKLNSRLIVEYLVLLILLGVSIFKFSVG
ncbi:MAG: hypothetical protein U9M98_01640 [Patescibacteria group bacterium]|nr:hypothetical protein [Patescibacteria group bacterium]